MVMFDIGSGSEALRRRLLRWMHKRHFGCLQKSVWARPDPCDDLADLLVGTDARSGSVLLFEGRQVLGGKADSDIVGEAWDFGAVNAAYAGYLEFARRGIPASRKAGAIRDWADRESFLWGAAMAKDPLLPKVLLPRGYGGEAAWEQRRKLLKNAGALREKLAGADG